MCSAPNRNAPTVVSGLLASSHVSGGGTMPRRSSGGQAGGGQEDRLLLHLAPGEGGELAAVLRDVLLDRFAAIEHHAATIRDAASAPHDQRAEDPRVTVDLEVAFDVDQPLEREIAV